MIKRIALVVAACALAGNVLAAGNADAGKAKTVACGACHGADGNSLAPTFPKLAGQHAGYLLKQLKDIKSGARNNGQTAAMKGVMHLVNDEEIKAIATWLESLK